MFVGQKVPERAFDMPSELGWPMALFTGLFGRALAVRV
jgi:hypothetical protein